MFAAPGGAYRHAHTSSSPGSFPSGTSWEGEPRCPPIALARGLSPASQPTRIPEARRMGRPRYRPTDDEAEADTRSHRAANARQEDRRSGVRPDPTHRRLRLADHRAAVAR